MGLLEFLFGKSQPQKKDWRYELDDSTGIETDDHWTVDHEVEDDLDDDWEEEQEKDWGDDWGKF
jgi:hypothetical protein